jgi:hypothetical protein
MWRHLGLAVPAAAFVLSAAVFAAAGARREGAPKEG